jgi:hypothetical protein
MVGEEGADIGEPPEGSATDLLLLMKDGGVIAGAPGLLELKRAGS